MTALEEECERRKSFENFEDLIAALTKNSFRWQKVLLLQCILLQFLIGMNGYAQSYLMIGKMDRECVKYENGVKPAVNETDKCEIAVAGNKTAHCLKWNYTSEYYDKTMQSEWNLVCKSSAIIPTYQSMFLVGYLIGVPIWSVLADAVGRRAITLIIWPIFIADFVGMYFAPNIVVAMFFRALQGFVGGAFWKATFVLNLEVNTPDRRNFTLVVSSS